MGFFDGAAGGIASGIGGILSSIFGNKAQRDANKANLQIAQMNNEWSEKMMEKQHAYDLEMWNKNNEYNDPSKQVERLKGAGINPALALSNISSGQASGGNSVGLPSPSRAEVKPLNYEGFANAINNALQASMAVSRNNAEIDALGERVEFERQMTRAKIAEMYENTRNTKFRNELNDITKDLQISNMNEDFLRKVQERSNMEEQQKLTKQMITAQILINQNLPDKLAMDIAVQTSIRDLNKKSIESVAQDIVRKSLENNQIDYSKEQFDRLKEATIDILEAQKVGTYVGAGASAIGALGSLGSWKRKPTQVYSPHNHYTNIYNP